MKKLYDARDPADAHLLNGLLDAAGIEAVIRGEYLWGVRGDVPMTPAECPSVWVLDDSDYERAMELVSEFRPADRDRTFNDEAWVCPRCRETNGEQFTECWNCGAPRSA